MLEYSNGRPVLRGGVCLWYLPTPLVYELGYIGSGDFIIVPAFDRESYTDEELRDIRADGVTDLASIPAIARGLMPPNGPWAKAAVIHDAGYVTRGWGGRMTRKQVDDLFKEAMEVLGVPAWKRAVIYAAVRVGGSRAFGT
jgi:hypothetical protein